MKVLLSAYACEPGRGSEPGLGWSWANAYVEAGHEVTVLVSGDRHGDKIRDFQRSNGLRFRVIFVDFWWPGPKREDIFMQRAHYLTWLVVAARVAARLIASGETFDLLHQVSWASIIYPCWLPKHSRLVMGPMGGAELPPIGLMRGFSLKGLALELARSTVVCTIRYSGLMGLYLQRADRIFLANRGSAWVVPPRLRERTAIMPQICTYEFPYAARARTQVGDHLRLLYVGRLLDWKGINIILSVVKAIAGTGRSISCSFVALPPSPRLVRKVARLGLSECVRFMDAVPRQALADIYRAHDVLLFPSLHDSGGLVVIEALASAVPVVCLDLGGPAMVVDETCGRRVRADGGWDLTVRRLRDAVLEVSQPDEFVRMSQGALVRARTRTSEWMMHQFESALQVERHGPRGSPVPEHVE